MRVVCSEVRTALRALDMCSCAWCASLVRPIYMADVRLLYAAGVLLTDIRGLCACFAHSDTDTRIYNEMCKLTRDPRFRTMFE